MNEKIVKLNTRVIVSHENYGILIGLRDDGRCVFGNASVISQPVHSVLSFLDEELARHFMGDDAGNYCYLAVECHDDNVSLADLYRAGLWADNMGAYLHTVSVVGFA